MGATVLVAANDPALYAKGVVVNGTRQYYVDNLSYSDIQKLNATSRGGSAQEGSWPRRRIAKDRGGGKREAGHQGRSQEGARQEGRG